LIYAAAAAITLLRYYALLMLFHVSIFTLDKATPIDAEADS